jgi:YD repeat-containing protein
MTSRNSRGAIASALLATGSFWTPAQAQVSPQEYATAPADHLLVTRTGIDLRSGQYQYRQTDLAIGGEGIGGLQLTRLSPPSGQAAMIEPYMIEPYAEAFGNFTHNLDIMIMETRVSIFTNNYHHGSGSDFRMFVRYGMPIETFDGRGSTPVYELVSKQATARLTCTGTASSDSVVYTYQNAEGTLVTFRSLGSRDCASAYRCAYVSDVVYPDGTKLSFEYSSTPGVANTARLRSVISSRGYAMLLEYGTGSYSKRVVKACLINLTQTVKPANNVCPVGAPASAYSYTTLAVFGPMLASSTDQGGGTWGYQYQTDAGGLLTATGYVKPGQQTPWMTFGPNHTQQFADGTFVDVDKQDGSSETEGQIHDGGGTAIYPDGGRVEALYAYPRYPASLSPGYNPDVPNNFCGEGTHENCVEPVYQITPGPVSVTDELGRVTTYEYCDPVIYASFPEYETDRCVVTPLRSYTDPEGIKTEIVYDAWRNVSGIHRKAKPGSGLPDLDLTAYYDCVNRPKSCAKPSSITDGRGNTTNWTYDPNHGGVLTETGPAVNGISPQKRYGYTQRYAWISNGAGGYVQAATPVWLRTSESFCKTSAWTGSACTAANDEVVTTYDYGPNSGPNNLWLRGTAVTADGVTRRTCFAYDGLGRKISETTPNANLASCP